MVTRTIDRTGPILKAFAAWSLAISTATYAHAQPSTPTGPTAATAPDPAEGSFDAERVGEWFVRRLTQSREFDLSYTMWRWRETRLPTMTDDEFESLEARVEDKPQHPDYRSVQREQELRETGGESAVDSAWIGPPGRIRVSKGSLTGEYLREYAINAQTRWRVITHPDDGEYLAIAGGEASQPENYGFDTEQENNRRHVVTFLAGVIPPDPPFERVERVRVARRGDGNYEVDGLGSIERENAPPTEWEIRAVVDATDTGDEPLIIDLVMESDAGSTTYFRYTVSDWEFSEALGARVLRAYERSTTPGVVSHRFELLEARRIDEDEFDNLMRIPLDRADPVFGRLEYYRVEDFRGTDGTRPVVREVSDSSKDAGDESGPPPERRDDRSSATRRTGTSPLVYIWGGAGALVLVLIAGRILSRARS